MATPAWIRDIRRERFLETKLIRIELVTQAVSRVEVVEGDAEEIVPRRGMVFASE